MKKLSWIVLITLTTFSSCELIIDIDVPYEGDKIVLNGIQSPDLPWTVELTHTRYILEDTKLPFSTLTQGDVTLTGDDGSVQKLNITGPGIFTANAYPLEGHTYTIVAKSPGFEDVRAEMKMPFAVRIKNVVWDSTEVRPSPNPNFYWSSNMKLDVTFDDPADAKNYYGILVVMNMTITYQQPNMPEPRTDSVTYFREVAILDPAIGTDENRPRRFSDNTFNGRTYTTHSDVQLQSDPNAKVYRIDVILVTVSEELFKYEESRNLYNSVEGDPFAQPVQVYSNVTNGFGIFAGTTRDVRSWGRKP
jgi:hypothetical protein